jgi:hypothetical protein
MAETPRLQLKRGLKANLPTTSMLAGEPHFTTDRGTLHVATDATTKVPVVPALEDLTSMGTVTGAEDLLIIHDASETSGQKEKKITFDNFKTALNIPEGSTDELVAVTEGAVAGYLEDVLVSSTSVGFEIPEDEEFMIAFVKTVDCGTF